MFIEKEISIHFDVDRFIDELYNYNKSYDYNVENVKEILIEYIDDLKYDEQYYQLFDDKDILYILEEIMEKLEKKKLSDEQKKELKADIKTYNNRIKNMQKEIERLENILKENE